MPIWSDQPAASLIRKFLSLCYNGSTLLSSWLQLSWNTIKVIFFWLASFEQTLRPPLRVCERTRHCSDVYSVWCSSRYPQYIVEQAEVWYTVVWTHSLGHFSISVTCSSALKQSTILTTLLVDSLKSCWIPSSIVCGVFVSIKAGRRRFAHILRVNRSRRSVICACITENCNYCILQQIFSYS